MRAKAKVYFRFPGRREFFGLTFLQAVENL